MFQYVGRDNGQGNVEIDAVMDGNGHDGFRVHTPAEKPDELDQPYLDDDGEEQNPGKCRPEKDCFRFDDLVPSPPSDLETGDKEDDGHDERRHVFHPSVAEGGPHRGGAGGDPETDDQNNSIGKVGKQVEGIGDHRHGPGHGSQGYLDREENKDDHDGDPSRQKPVAVPHISVIQVVKVPDQFPSQGLMKGFKYLHGIFLVQVFPLPLSTCIF